MQLDFKISKQLNLFQFVNNFSGWHFSCRKQYVDEWIKATGHLNKIEQEALNQLSKVLSKYGFGNGKAKNDKYVNVYELFAVADANTLKKELDAFLGIDDSENITKSIRIFSSRFAKIWGGEEIKLRKEVKTLENKNIEHGIIETIKKLFPECNAPEKVEVYLQMSINDKVGGGANIGLDRITLECSGTKNEDVMSDVMWHEITHIMLKPYNEKVFESQNKFKLEDFNTIRKGGYYNPFSEAIVYGFFGGLGFLNRKYFPHSISQSVSKIASDGYELVKTDIDPWKWLLTFLSERVGKYYDQVLRSNEQVDLKTLGNLVASGIEDFKKLIAKK